MIHSHSAAVVAQVHESLIWGRVTEEIDRVEN